MNLAILIARFPPGALGGAERQAEGWAARLATRHRVTVIARAEPPHPPGRIERDGYTLIRVPFGGPPVLRTWRDVRAIERTIAALSPRPDVTLCFQTFVSGFAGLCIKRRLGIPFVVWIRGEGEFAGGHWWQTRWIGPRVWRAADAVLVQSEGIRHALIRTLRARRIGAADAIAARTDVIRNGLELPAAANALAMSGPVLTVARLITDKGVDTVIDAVATTGWPLVVAGAGPEQERLEARACGAGVSARFEGAVDPQQLAELYRKSACVVLASRRGEGMPNVLLEAMAHGRPVVATRVPGTLDLISHEANGLLVPADQPLELRSAIERLRCDPRLAARLAARARADAEQHDWNRVRPALEAVLERCVR